MKKVIALVLTFALALSLCACNLGEIVNKEISRGVIDENGYSSDYLGLRFTAPEGWVYATQSELSALMGEAVDITDQNKLFTELQLVYDMMVQDLLTGSNVIIIYENLAVSGSEDITVEEYVEITKQGLTSVDMFTYTFNDEATVTLGDVDFTRVTVTCEYNGFTMEQAYYIAKLGSYMASISVTVTDGTSIETIEACFSALE